eukprot:Nk52_evm14s349 gene=Nk52_evmTU14s349
MGLWEDLIRVREENQLLNIQSCLADIKSQLEVNGSAILKSYQILKMKLYMPGLLIIQSSQDTPLYAWAIEPKVTNLGGASDRPVLNEIWKAVKEVLESRLESGGEIESDKVEELRKRTYKRDREKAFHYVKRCLNIG